MMAAPIAQLDDEWENFSSFSADFAQNDLFNKVAMDDEINRNTEMPENNENLDNLRDPELLSYRSMEDLVHTFDEKLASCFRLDSKNIGGNSGHSSVFDESILSQDQLWKRLTDNYGLVQPLNWETSHIRKLHIPALCLPFNDKTDKNQNPLCKNKAEIQDIVDNELEQQMDYHRMIEYNVYSEDKTFFQQTPYQHEAPGEVMQTADEVIEELEEIMQDAADINAAVDYEIQQETGIVFDENSLDEELEGNLEPSGFRPSLGSPSSQEESDRATVLKCMSLSELNSLNEDLDEQVKLLSAELLEKLNNRDELQYENEVKNTFISKVLEVQYKREQFCKNITTVPVSKKFGRLRRATTSDSVSSQGRYLTTVIPSTKGEIITLDSLLVLIKILNAIKADSDEVPSLLTSYILKVLCPAPSGTRILKL